MKVEECAFCVSRVFSLNFAEKKLIAWRKAAVAAILGSVGSPYARGTPVAPLALLLLLRGGALCLPVWEVLAPGGPAWCVLDEVELLLCVFPVLGGP